MRNSLFTVLRWLTVVLAVALLVGMCARESDSEAELSDVLDAVSAQMKFDNLQLAEGSMVRRLYGLDPSEYADCVLYYPKTNMDADELLLIRLRDGSQRDTVLAAIESRLSAQKSSFEGYGVEQTDLLTNHAVTEARGNFILFVVSENAAQVRSAFRNAL